jgi:hypothetical protein
MHLQFCYVHHQVDTFLASADLHPVNDVHYDTRDFHQGTMLVASVAKDFRCGLLTHHRLRREILSHIVSQEAGRIDTAAACQKDASTACGGVRQRL